jgi:hypothetical protein
MRSHFASIFINAFLNQNSRTLKRLVSQPPRTDVSNKLIEVATFHLLVAQNSRVNQMTTHELKFTHFPVTDAKYSGEIKVTELQRVSRFPI